MYSIVTDIKKTGRIRVGNLERNIPVEICKDIGNQLIQ